MRERTFLIEDLDSKGGLLGGQDGGRGQDGRLGDEAVGRENGGRIKEADLSPRYGQVKQGNNIRCDLNDDLYLCKCNELMVGLGFLSST